MSGQTRDQPKFRLKVKVNKRRDSRSSDVSSSLDLSNDEGGYSGIEDISDSDEDDDEHVNAAEEEHIRERKAQIPRASPRPPVSEDDDDGDDEDEEAIEDDDDESVDFEGFNDIAEQPQNEASPWSQPDTVERRVRFDVPESSDSDSTDTDEEVDNGFFPDIFVPRDSLDPSFRRAMERNEDGDDDDNSSNSGMWDLYGYNDNMNVYSSEYGVFELPEESGDSTPDATPLVPLESMFQSENADEDSSAEGHDSDGGETTDEEENPAQLTRHKSRKEQEDDSSDSESVTLIRPRRGQPRVGRFNLDRSTKKPVAMVNPATGKLMIFTPLSGSRFDLSPEQFNGFPWPEAASGEATMVDSGNMMMSAMVSSNTFGDIMNTQTIGPEEAFFSLPNDMDIFEGFSSGPDDQSGDVEERNLAIDDFLNLDNDFGGSSDEEDNPLDLDEDPFLCTPQRPNTSSGDVSHLLDHFETNADIVGAFRRDQANHNLISRSKATRDSLAFSGPLYEGTLRGIKEGRIPSTNVPISPLRKQRRATDAASSPLGNSSQKRKASSEQHFGHKRHRSIPDVNLLNI